MRHLLTAEDLFADGVADVLAHPSTAASLRTVGLLFQTPSLRTQTGFAVAAARLGATPVLVSDLRHDGKMSVAESMEDTVRVLSGQFDALVVRADVSLTRSWVDQHAVCPVLNAGDAVEHPSQALIDVYAMERMCGPLESLRIGMIGDLQMRSATSLLRYLARRPPVQLLLSAPPTRSCVLPEQLRGRVAHVSPEKVVGMDVLVMVGLPARRGDDALSVEQRAPYTATPAMLDRQRPHAALLSPMPVIDEISPAARLDPRARYFEQADLALNVRVGLLGWLAGGAGSA